MYPPASIMTDYITLFRAMPTLVTLAGNTDTNLYAQHAAKDTEMDSPKAVASLKVNEAMLSYQSSATIRTADRLEKLSHSFQLVYRASKQSDFLAFWTEFYNGTPTGSAEILRQIQLQPCLSRMTDIQANRQIITVSETANLDLLVIGFAVRQSGS